MNKFNIEKEALVKLYNRNIIKRVIEFIAGCFIIAFSYNLFIAPNSLIPGGVGGIAIYINKLFGYENSIIILCINILLIILSIILLDFNKTRASLLGSLLFPLCIKLTEHTNVFLQIDTSHTLLTTIFGGIIYGFGVGLVFKAGFTTGGTDIINQIISKYLKFSLGKSMLLSDGLIVICSSFIFGINKMMYSIILLYIISIISDKVVLGISDNKTFFIITNKDLEVKNYILKELAHGVTIYKAKGGYRRDDENVLMAVLPTKEYYHLRDGIKKIDEEAFYIITDTYELFGGE